jgi:hypothetical protein
MERDPNCKYAAEKETVLVSRIQLQIPHGDRADLDGIVRWIVNAKEGSNLWSQLVARK